MIGTRYIVKKTQTKEAQPTTVSKQVIKNNSQTQSSSYSSNRRNNQENNYSVINKQKESNTPYKITIKTIIERGKKGQQEKYESKTDDSSKRHYHKLTAEERKKFSRGIRPNAAQREMDKYNQMNQKQKDEMIEIIDNTDRNQNIKLKPNNKTTLINRNKAANATNVNDIRRKYARGLRQKEAEKEMGEIEVKEIKEKENGQKKPIVINDQTNNRRNNRQNQEIQLIPNKKTVIRNPKPRSPNPSSSRLNSLPQNYDPKRNLTKKVEKTTSRLGELDSNKKGGYRNNTVSHAIIDIKRTERKPYVLNERKTDIIKFNPNHFLKYNNSKEKTEPYKGGNNHSIIVTKNVTNDSSDKKAHHRYNHSLDPNLKNTYSHKIDMTKKEPKKEVVVQPRKLTVIKSVIPSRRRNITEANNDASNKKPNQNLFTRKYETDKKAPSSLAKKIENVRVYKDNIQNKQKDNQNKNDKNIPDYKNNRRSSNEP